MSRRRRIVLGAIGLVVLLILLVVARTLQENNWYQPRITQAEVRRQITQGLPMGSTLADTIKFLGARGWVDPKNLGVYSNRGNDSSDGFEQKDLTGKTLLASIDNAYPGFLVSGGIYMKFGFNAKGRLTRYELRDVYTGL